MANEEELQLRIHQLEKEIKKLHSQIKKQRYGLVWLDVPEAFDEESENKIPILEEVKEKAIRSDDGKPTHILIEGDNYHALECLNYTHRGKIDVIYIDPPYNTGSDGFIYKDKRILTEYPDGTPVPKEHPLRHSYWLSFMSKRLELAKNLLSDKGIIFISIDDNEQANLKLLCDKVFGEDNFVANLIWQKKKGGSNDSKYVATEHEYVIMYAKKLSVLEDIFISYEEQYLSRYKEVDEIGRFFWDTFKRKSGKQYYAIKCPDGTILDKESNGEPISWLRSEQRFLSDLEQGEARIIKINDKWTVHFKQRQPEGYKPRTLMLECGTTSDGATQMKEMFRISNKFDNPKPSTLIEFLLKFKSNNSIILDFFAGSGTTMHAVMKLNEEDGGKRQCILVQQKEGDNNICENITYERNRRVMQGYTNAKGEQVAGLGNSMKYYKTAFVGKNASNNATDTDRVELSLKAGYLLALGENTLEEIITHKSYQIFSDEKGHFTAVYFTGNLNDFPEFVEEIEKFQTDKSVQIVVYIFCWGSVDIYENEFDNLNGITLKPIPQPILDIYKSINA